MEFEFVFFLNWGEFFFTMGTNVLEVFENIVLLGHFIFQLGAIGGKCLSGICKCFFFNWGAKHNFGIEKTRYFGNYMEPCILLEQDME